MSYKDQKLAWLAKHPRATTDEYQRDSIAYVLDKYIQCYDSVIVDGDTIKFER